MPLMERMPMAGILALDFGDTVFRALMIRKGPVLGQIGTSQENL